MAITNNQIVFSAWCELVAAGTISENEEIHTFDFWKKSGYIVKRGQKAVCSLMIWKYSTKKSVDDSGNEIENGSMFMKKAYFFSTNQVEKIQPVKRVSAAEMIGKTIVLQTKPKTKRGLKK